MSVRGYTRISARSAASGHALDSLFLLLVGLVFLIARIVVFLLFGGLEGDFAEEGYTAVNINIVLLTALPVPFLSGVGTGLSTREDSRTRRVRGTGRGVVDCGRFGSLPCFWRDDAHDAVRYFHSGIRRYGEETVEDVWI